MAKKQTNQMNNNAELSNEDLINADCEEFIEGNVYGMLNLINKNSITQNDNIVKLLKIILGVLILLLVATYFK